MSNLDDRLREIVAIIHTEEGCKLVRPCPVENQGIRAIREAFADERTSYVADFSNGKLSELMTGQEWYDRFVKQLPTPLEVEGWASYDLLDKEDVMAAAKQAAGLSGEHNTLAGASNE